MIKISNITFKINDISKFEYMSEWISFINDRLNINHKNNLYINPYFRNHKFEGSTAKDIMKELEMLFYGKSKNQRTLYIYIPIGVLWENEVKERFDNIFSSPELDRDYKTDFIDLDTNTGYSVKMSKKTFMKKLNLDIKDIANCISKYKLKEYKIITFEGTFLLKNML